MPKPYSEIKELLPFDDHGWYANRKPIERLIKARQVKTVIEVGCWLSKSTRHIAKQLPRGGKIYAVDHWQGSLEHQPGQNSSCKNLSLLFDQFCSNVIHSKLTHKIIPVRLPSIDAEKYLSDIFPDLIYIDASHEFEPVYQDLTIWFPYVEGHSVLCGDDWAFPEVQEAVKKFAKEKNLSIEVKSPFWMLIEEPALTHTERRF